MWMIQILGVAALTWLVSAGTARAAGGPLDRQVVNGASFVSDARDKRALVIKTEVLLDRAGFSPGVIDGRDGDNFRKAVATFQRQNALDSTGVLDAETFSRLAATSSEPALTEYEISNNDVRGPFEKHIPAGFDAMAKVRRLSYTGPREELAERFHMGEKLLAELNPHADFHRPGTRIVAANVGSKGPQANVAKIVIDKQKRSLSAFDSKGNLIVFYPASIGSAEKPAPSGTYKVNGVERNPTYHYDPKFAFKGVKARHKLTIQPGPNNPVGLVWINLSVPSYGIHGTPSPENVGKTESHGCIRLTNWDALALASMVSRGTLVDFDGGNVQGDTARTSKPD
jgi:lipoprotein-anchoring transpeptidase ErfK/SrfK